MGTTGALTMTQRRYIIREATLADADTIAEIGRVTFHACFAYSMPEEDVQAYLDKAYSVAAIAEEVADAQRNSFFVAQIDRPGTKEHGKVVGFVQMKLGTTEPCLPPDADLCELHRIYVSLDCTSGGVGKMLAERGISWAREWASKCCTESGGNARAGIWLGVWEENFKAQRFYQRLGFERVGSHDFAMGDTIQTDWVLVKWL